MASSINQQTSAGKYVEKREHVCTVDGNADWCSQCGKQYRHTSKIKNRSTFWPSDPTSGNISEGTQNSCSKEHSPPPMSTEVLFTVAKIWKQPKCPSVDEWIKQLWGIYNNGILLSCKKEENTLAIACHTLCDSMDGPGELMLSEIS